MKVLFVMRHPGFLRNFESLLRELATRGHDVMVAVEFSQKYGHTLAAMMDSLSATGRIAFVDAPARSREPAYRAATQIRLALDYLRYLGPLYDDKPKLRSRAGKATPAPLRRLVRLAAARGPQAVAVVRRALLSLDVAAPLSPQVQDFLDRHRPDLLALTPLIELGAPQTDYLRAANTAGIPTVHAVASWDNLTVKGALRDYPDLVAVWNEAQRSEARDLHGVPARRVTVTGAHTYDHWFSWEAERDRDAFCTEVGLPADRPYILYLCSSPFIAPAEAAFVREWVTGLRASDDERLRDAGVLVRPHPQHAAQWSDVDLADLGHAVVWPRAGADPVERGSRQDFYESMLHCAAVVGVNTSALIESAIVGRDTLTLLDPRFAGTQEGTMHFGHLSQQDDGILTVARTIEQHHRQLSDAVAGKSDGEVRRRRFLTTFVRPHGLEVAGAPVFANALEQLVAAGTRASCTATADERRHPRSLAVSAWRAFAAVTGWLSRRRRRPLGRSLRPTARRRTRFVYRRTRRVYRRTRFVYRRTRMLVGRLLGRGSSAAGDPSSNPETNVAGSRDLTSASHNCRALRSAKE